MSIRLHQEYTAVVARPVPWGVVVTTDAGDEVSVDKTKLGSASLDVGTEVQVVILDDARTPPRGSLLDLDRDIARQLRGREEL